MIRFAFAIATTIGLAAPVVAESYPDTKSIVSVGGPITEIIYALGEEDRVIARDTTSRYPAEANALPDVGYMRRLSAEGVLSVSPDLVIARSTSGPPETIEQLAASSVPMVFAEDGFDQAAVSASVLAVGEALGTQDKAQVLVAQIKADFAKLDAELAGVSARKRVMFVLSLDGGRMNAAGRGTGANGIIELAGGLNVFGDSFESYKLVDAEAVISAAPDVIIMMESRANHEARKDEVLGLAPVKLTPAGQNEAFVTIPGAALGFGPRTADFARELHDLIYNGNAG